MRLALKFDISVVRRLALAFCLSAALAACGSLSVEADYPENDNGATAESGSVFSFLSLGKEKPSASEKAAPAQNAPVRGLRVNALLWQASLETLSFLPLASADPMGGVILTDWYNDPSANNERIKVNLFISGRELRADALRVSVFRETLRNGKWVSTAASSKAARQLENIVLTRARDLSVARRAER